MYLPKSKYRVKTPPAGTFQTQEGIDYKGPVVELNTGEVYAGDSITNLGSRLIDPTLETAPVEIPQPFNEYIPPTEEDYKKGRFVRYLLRNEKTKRVVETSKKQFEENKNLPNIQQIRVQWLLTGQIEDKILPNNVLAKGIRTLNQETINKLSKEFVGIEVFLNDPLKFVR